MPNAEALECQIPNRLNNELILVKLSRTPTSIRMGITLLQGAPFRKQYFPDKCYSRITI